MLAIQLRRQGSMSMAAGEQGASALADAPEGVRELVESVGLEPLRPLFADLDAELAGLIARPSADREVMAAQAHGLVGAAGGMGFSDFAHRCRLLEHACRERSEYFAELGAAQASAERVRAVIAGLTAPAAAAA